MKNITILLLMCCGLLSAQPFFTETLNGIRQYAGSTNQAILEVRFGNTNTSLEILKPLIVVEGFDSGILGAESEFGESSLQQFLDDATGNTGNLGLEILTYDIIYINFKKGKDDLRRNAYLVQDVIKWVNAQKALAGSTIPNVVLGQSMGGVIARYALRDMENQFAANPQTPSWQHNTSLYISHDAPHQGANIPLGIQYFARHIIDQFVSTPLGDMNINPCDGAPVSIEDLKNLLDATGTKQL